LQEKRKYNVIAVSYLNTLPFIYGINHYSNRLYEFALETDIPSVCALKILNNEPDIGLVPTAILPELKDYEIFSDYCIGADGEVNSVVLFSDSQLEEIKTIYLDHQSRTSVQLIKLLAHYHWSIQPEWKNAVQGYEKMIQGDTAALVIGDRAMNLHGKYKYAYDLGAEWKKYTGKPFVFACWVCKKNVSAIVRNDFNMAIKYGVENKSDVINLSVFEDKQYLRKYFEKYISYDFDSVKKEALSCFFHLIQALPNQALQEC
jgi:chorismate dehydratase